MDILIAALLFITAIMMVLGRPFKIEVYHKYPEVKHKEIKEDEETRVPDGFTSAISAINAFMTGEEVSDGART